MKKALVILVCLLTSCAAVKRNSFLIYDRQTQECWYLYNSNLYITQEASWTNWDNKTVHTSKDFDLRVVNGEDYPASGKSMGIDISHCRNALQKR